MKCEKCGTPNPEAFRFCDACGTPLFKPNAAKKPLAIPSKQTLIERAIELLKESNHTTTAFLQGGLGITLTRAELLMEELEDMGVVGPNPGTGMPRSVLRNGNATADLMAVQGGRCVVCGSGHLVFPQNIVLVPGVQQNVRCDRCNTEYCAADGKWVLKWIPLANVKWSEYEGRALTVEEIRRIIDGGRSDGEILQQLEYLGLGARARATAEEREPGWKSLFLAQVLVDEIASIKARTPLAPQMANVNRHPAALEFLFPWVTERSSEIRKIATQLLTFLNAQPRLDATADALAIVSLTKEIAKAYKGSVEWMESVRSLSVEPAYDTVVEELASYARTVIEGVERLAQETMDRAREDADARRAGVQTANPISIEIRLPPESSANLVSTLERLIFVTTPTLKSFLGQDVLLMRLRSLIQQANRQGHLFKHTLLCGTDGEGKAFLATCMAGEMQLPLTRAKARDMRKREDLAAVVQSTPPGGIVLLEGIHELNQPCTNYLISVLREGNPDYDVRRGPVPRQMRLSLMTFTLIGTAPQAEQVRQSLRYCIDHELQLATYDERSLTLLLLAWTRGHTPGIEPSGAQEISTRACGSLRMARQLTQQAKAYAIVNNENVISSDIARQALDSPGQAVAPGHPNQTRAAFELRCLDALHRRNLSVKQTRRLDGGNLVLVVCADDLAASNKHVVHCIHTSEPAEVRDLNEILASMYGENAGHGILIVPSRFTNDAKEFAEGKGIELVDGMKLDCLLDAS